ncbi:MAG: hypothetical protein ACLFVJ_11540 [Persicimonas sp.]
MQTRSNLRLIAITLTLAFVAGLLGCDEARLQSMNNEEEASQDTSTDDEDEEIEQGPTDEHGHGIDPETEGETIPPGFMNGSWRAATGDQDTPAVYFDTFQDEGEPEVTGTYLMALGINDRLDGESGDLAEASFDGTTLTIEWNPTTDPAEMYTLQADKVDEDTLEGRVTAERNPELDEVVTLTRREDD